MIQPHRLHQIEDFFRGYRDGRYHHRKDNRRAFYLRGYARGEVVKEPISGVQLENSFFGQMLETLLNRPIPFPVPVLGTRLMVAEDLVQLQEFCTFFARPDWVCGSAVIEAAELMVSKSLANLGSTARKAS